MPEQSGNPEQPPVGASGSGYRDEQLAALRDVLELSAEAIRAVEQPLERKYRKTLEATRRRYEEVGGRIRERRDQRLGRLQRTHTRQIEQIESVYRSDLKALETNHASVAGRVQKELDSKTREARRKYDQEVWVTESVADATRSQLAADLEELHKSIPHRRAEITAIREQAAWYLDDYGHAAPDDAVAANPPPDSADDAFKAFQTHLAEAESHLQALASLALPRWVKGTFSGFWIAGPAGVGFGLAVLFWWGGWLDGGTLAVSGPAGVAAGAAIGWIALRVLRPRARARVEQVSTALHRSLAEAAACLDAHFERAREAIERRQAETSETREAKVRAAKEVFESAVGEVRERCESLQGEAERAYASLKQEIEKRHETHGRQVEEDRARREPILQQRFERYVAAVERWYQRRSTECEEAYRSERTRLEQDWSAALARIQAMLAGSADLERRCFQAWDDPAWTDWSPPSTFTSVIRFGRLHLDLGRIPEHVRALVPWDGDIGTTAALPAVLSFPDRASLLIQSGQAGRAEAIRAVQAVMVRLLTLLPPGRVRFTIIDPVGLGENFAGFMHLADHVEALVDGRIWTEAAHVEQRLADLTAHMENVIQKYLRNEFSTIEEYNAQAGELAEPYRFLVIAGFPMNFNEESLRRLNAIAASGPRCGVYTLVAHDTRQETPPGFAIDDLKAGSVNVVWDKDRFVWRHDVFRRFPLTLDGPPRESVLTGLMHRIGEAARDATRVEVPFTAVAPREDQYWTGSTESDLAVPIGRTGATRLQRLRLGKGVAQHAMIAGKTGSGKSTLLHAIVTNLVLWYPPDEVEFYLIDFKQGVEFKVYAEHALPHARAVAIESDREFGLSVLQRLDREMERRGELFRQAGAQDLAAYRRATGRKLPRTLLIVDEFQVFFAEDDKLSQDSGVLLDRLVRQGRAFGIHVLLGSQTLGGTWGLSRSTVGQMAVRIALQCSEADSQLILDDDNTAARLLSRPGEAIYNDAGGLVQGNSPFQTAWLPDDERDGFLQRVADLSRERAPRYEPPVVFEGNAPADIRKNGALADLLDAAEWPAPAGSPRAWLGEAVAIKPPTAITLARQSGANVIMVGQQEESALALTASMLVSLAAQRKPDAARFVVMDGTPTDSPLAGRLERLTALLPHQASMVEWRGMGEALGDLVAELNRRQEADETGAPSIYLFINGLQRYRMLRRSEDDFSFSPPDEEKPADPARQFADLLREGPPLGIHVIAWADTLVTLERTLDRQVLREFDHRVLFQMSAADSSNLIDSPAANRLGMHRALLFSEEHGVMEKFRPYGLPENAWLEDVARRLARRSSASPAGGPPASAPRPS